MAATQESLPGEVKISRSEAEQILQDRARRLVNIGIGDYTRCCESAKTLWPKLWARATESAHDPNPC
jgi:hypothetical protein